MKEYWTFWASGIPKELLAEGGRLASEVKRVEFKAMEGLGL